MAKQIEPGDKVCLSPKFKALVERCAARGLPEVWTQDELRSFEGRVVSISHDICKVAGPDEIHHFEREFLEYIREFK